MHLDVTQGRFSLIEFLCVHRSLRCVNKMEERQFIPLLLYRKQIKKDRSQIRRAPRISRATRENVQWKKDQEETPLCPGIIG